MNYRHGYHAGNFCDVFKHLILIILVEKLKAKPRPFCYLDSHAGSGIYDLTTEFSQKTLEYQEGIVPILAADPGKLTQPIQLYLQLLAKLNHCADHKELQASNLKLYPGSPLIVRKLLRPQDRMIITELHPKESLKLKQLFRNDVQVAAHSYDGYQGLKAFLPSNPKRALVLIDPPFEDPHEDEAILTALTTALARCPSATYAVWYPIKEPQLSTTILTIAKTLQRPYLQCEMTLHKPQSTNNALIGCGMLIVNPPWDLEPTLKPTLNELWSILAKQREGTVRYTKAD